MCIGKIYRATVTDADLDYVGSITVDKKLIEAAGMFPSQMVQITNLSNGTLWRTYIIEGKRGEVCLNGPPARHFQKGDKVIILAEGFAEVEGARKITPTVVFVNAKNKITKIQKGRN